ncbi:alcohol dehydrogenase catalytic domain-containing protein [Peribacillus sp. NPDC097264]|uniref:alcohol dehydrogenase catalytic domain-containing protein n=1 Tax=Peribacillus sp. NPDC097264 TaxID=3390616 RepID=UPI003CFC0670
MRACYIESFGGPEKIKYGEVPAPLVGKNDVLVKTAACGVCYHDTLTRKGVFPRTKLPVILGHQAAGEVLEVGSSVQEIKQGDRVLCLPFSTCGECEYCLSGREPLCQNALFVGEELDGGYAELVSLPETAWVKVPDEVSDDVAAVLACSLGTAYHAIKTIAQVQPDENVVITGSSGGIGTHAIDVLKWIGARIIAITSSESKVEYLKKSGADEVIINSDATYSKEVKKLTNGKGADCILEIVGGSYIPESLKSLKKDSRIVLIGNVSGTPTELKPAVMILKQLRMLGTKGVTRSEMQEILGLVKAGELNVNISEIHHLKQTSVIHERMAKRDTTARVVLHPNN